MRLTKIYTKTGDKGETMLANGSMVGKSQARIHAVGSVDELNAYLGLLSDELSAAANDDFVTVCDQLYAIQNELFDLGGELATPHDCLDTTKQQVVSPEKIARLEREIDTANTTLPPLENFVLPGGHRLNSVCHIARTICRRAERWVVEASSQEDIRPVCQQYLNRLSDWLFVYSRWLAKKLNTEERQWQQQK